MIDFPGSREETGRPTTDPGTGRWGRQGAQPPTGGHSPSV